MDVEIDWATFGDREQKFVAAIEAGNPPDIAEMHILGPTRYKAALRDVSKLAGDIARAQGRPACPSPRRRRSWTASSSACPATP